MIGQLIKTVYMPLITWLYLPRAHTNLIARLAGLLAIPIGAWVCYWAQGGPGPLVVPAWRWGRHLLQLPLPPYWANIAIFSIYVIASLLMIFGFRRKLLLAIPIAFLAYYGSCDWMAAGPHFHIMEFCILVALLFDQPQKSYTRRLIQVAIATCYGYTTIHKILFPDFMNGYSMEVYFGHGAEAAGYLAPIFRSHPLPHVFWMIVSWLIIATEGFLTFGLFFNRTRKASLILAFLLHATITLLMFNLQLLIFCLVMYTGLLAFIEPPQSDDSPPTMSLQESNAHSGVQPALACAFFSAMLLIPLRIFFWPGHPLSQLSYWDRSPWVFGMGVMHQRTKSISSDYLDAKGEWHQVPLKEGRLSAISTDNEIYSLAKWLFAQHSDATQVKITVVLSINDRWQIVKTFTTSPTACDRDSDIQVEIIKDPLTALKDDH